jgi:uncharacterized circularly permuted ATP-grasp superfamily protein
MIPSSKWRLHQFFSKDPFIRTFLPPTSLYTRTALETFLSKYGTVYVKPSNKHMGKGIMKAWKTQNGYQVVKERGRPVHASSLAELHQTILQQFEAKRYVIQKGLDVAEIDGRPFDIRVMMMRNGMGRWTYAGMLAKVAGEGSVITNMARGGGYVTTVKRALLRSNVLEPAKIRQMIRNIVTVSHHVCRHFNKYKYSSQIGIDCAVDKNGTLSIIEVNFDFPSHGLFAKLKDKTYYRTIKRLAAQFRSRVKRKKRR